MVQLSQVYMTIGKTIALTLWAFVGQVMSLFFNMLYRLVITFLPRNKCLLISWLQSPSAVILEPRKIKYKYTNTGGAWWAAIYGVAQSWTRLKQLSSSSIQFISYFYVYINYAMDLFFLRPIILHSAGSMYTCYIFTCISYHNHERLKGKNNFPHVWEKILDIQA